MKAKFLKGVVAGVVMGGLTIASTAAFAGNGIGSVFNLGKTNAVNGSTVLQGSTNAPQLRVANSNTGAAATGIGIQTDARRPPLAVNSQTKVANLNGDLLDGLDSSAFQRPTTGTCPNGGIASIGASGSVVCGTSTQLPMHAVFASGQAGVHAFSPTLTTEFQCHTGNGFVGPVFDNTGPDTGSLNWMFSEGGSTSTVNANGQDLASGTRVGFSMPGTRLAGQFIWTDAHHVITLHLNVINDGVRCVFDGTALVVGF